MLRGVGSGCLPCSGGSRIKMYRGAPPPAYMGHVLMGTLAKEARG